MEVKMGMKNYHLHGSPVFWAKTLAGSRHFASP
jgi:hypothetical protein